MKATSGYFYGLNDQTQEQAFKDFLDDRGEPFATKEAALADSENERRLGNFFDDDAKVTVYHFEIVFKKADVNG